MLCSTDPLRELSLLDDYKVPVRYCYPIIIGLASKYVTKLGEIPDISKYVTTLAEISILVGKKSV